MNTSQCEKEDKTSNEKFGISHLVRSGTSTNSQPTNPHSYFKLLSYDGQLSTTATAIGKLVRPTKVTLNNAVNGLIVFLIVLRIYMIKILIKKKTFFLRQDCVLAVYVLNFLVGVAG